MVDSSAVATGSAGVSTMEDVLLLPTLTCLESKIFIALLLFCFISTAAPIHHFCAAEQPHP